MTPLRLAAAAVLPLLGACVQMPDIPASQPPAAAQPQFDPLAFFSGRLKGEGQLAKLFSGTVPVEVESQGRVENGVLILDQSIREGDKPPRTRQWIMREVAPGRYAGTLTDAEGEITGKTIGNRLHLTFKLPGGYPAEQWLTLSPDGRRAYNELTVRRFGLPVAKLAEDIRKTD